MRNRLATAGLLLLLAGTAGARPSVEIVSPAEGGCVASGLPPLPGAPNGEPLTPAVDVPLRLRLAETAGAAIDVTVTVDGEVVARDTYDPAGAAAEVTDRFVIPAQAIADGAGRRIAVTVESGGERSTAAVTVTVDRTPPRVVFEEDELARLGQCIGAGDPPALRYRVEDALDPQPTAVEALEVDGCAVDRVVTVRDHCGEGNAQRVPFRSRRAPAAAPRIVVEGVENGGSYLAPSVGFRVEAGPACVVNVEATIARDAEIPAPVVAGAVVEAPGQYVLSVTAHTCAAQPVTSRTAFTVLPSPSADAGGPYAVAQGAPLTLDGGDSTVPEALGAIVEYAWDLNADGFFDEEEGRGAQVPFDTLVPDGEYPVALRITTDQGLVEYDYTEVVVLDVTPSCDAGGPYEVEQGAALAFDASASRAGHPMEPILAFGWDFGDDRFPQRGAGLTRPSHRYEAEGDFVVTLTAEDIDSRCTARANVHVADVRPVIRNARARDADRLVEGVPVVFTAAQTSAGSDAEPIIAFRWDFGDGTPVAAGADLRGPSHVYARGGDYTVCLEVADADSSVRECFDIVVADLDPLARLDGPDYAIEGEEVVFDAGRSRPGGDADPLRRFTWDFGDGSPPLVVDPSERQVTHVFLRDGLLTVTLTVADQDSERSVTHEILVDDATPVARFAIDAEAVFEGVPVRFDARASAPGGPGDPIVSYEWHFGDGTPPAAEREARHAFPDDGEYLVRLVIHDQDGSRAAAERSVLVRNRAPGDVRIVADTALVESGRDATFHVEYDEAPGDLPRVTWLMGDGTQYDGRDRVTHRFAAPGVYGVRVTLDDREGGVAEARLDVAVSGAGPILGAPALVEGMEGRPVAFDVDVEAAPDGQGGVDGPVALSLALAPRGAEGTVVDVGDGRARRRLHVTWTPGLIDAGDHRVRVVARSPAGIVRAVDVALRVTESGAPLLAALGGAATDGRLTLHAWRHDPIRRADQFEIIADLPLGAGGGELAVSPRGDRVFVTVPGAGALAVAETGATPRLVRRVPLAGRPLAVVYGGDRVWVFDGVEGRLSVVDPDRLKVSAVLPLPGARELVAAAWLPGGEAGDRLLAVSQASGELFVLDPDDARAPVQARVALGGRPQRIVVDAEAGLVRVADGKGRRLLALAAADLLAGEAPAIEATDVPFAPRDMAAGGGAVWTAGEGGLARLDAAGVYRELRREPLESVTVLPSSLHGIPALAIGSRLHVESVGAAALDTLAGIRGAGARRLLQFTRFDP